MNAIAVIGLGYVGYPLYEAILRTNPFINVYGFDIDENKVQEYKDKLKKKIKDKNFTFNNNYLSNYCDILIKNIAKNGVINNTEVEKENKKINPATFKFNINITSDIKELKNCDIFFITVPTPIDDYNEPDMNCVNSAIENIFPFLNSDSVVIIESTMSLKHYEQCKQKINLKTKHIVFSPERFSPGDNVHTFKTITKLIGSETEYGLETAKNIYSKFCKNYKIVNIKTAIMSKLLENIQRDVNIALINEYSSLCADLNIDIYDVLDAAKTKWNFIDFVPGFVNGHCIPTDPYYLLDEYNHDKEKLNNSVINHSRIFNELYPDLVLEKIINRLKSDGLNIEDLTVNVLGYNTIKKDCLDSRNVKGLDLVYKLSNNFKQVTAFDINTNNVLLEEMEPADILIILQDHSIFNFCEKEKLIKFGGYLVDIKNIISKTFIYNYKLKKILC